MSSQLDARRKLPSTSALLNEPAIQQALFRLPRTVIVQSLRDELEQLRDTPAVEPVSAERIARAAIMRAEQYSRTSLQPAVNATGVVLHTGLGRAVLAEAAGFAVAQTAAGHCTLEVDVATGKRGYRQKHISDLLRRLTGCEAALAVNNNAASVFLAVAALATGREVIISRGELIEIGGSFRIPEIITASGAKLVEVGTTNRTRVADYAAAITPNTGLIMRCHPSNFRMVGFTEEAAMADLVKLGKIHGIAVMDDLGSGAIAELEPLLGPGAPTLAQALTTGCGIVTASADKLLGGPQSGLILGNQHLVRQIESHPLARAVRIDKLSLAALEATLRLYLDSESAWSTVPTLRYLARTTDELKERATTLAAVVREVTGVHCTVDTVSSCSQVGGGALPGRDLETTCVRLQPNPESCTVEQLMLGLRTACPPVYCRTYAGAALLDPRTLEDSDSPIILQALRHIFDIPCDSLQTHALPEA